MDLAELDRKVVEALERTRERTNENELAYYRARLARDQELYRRTAEPNDDSSFLAHTQDMIEAYERFIERENTR